MAYPFPSRDELLDQIYSLRRKFTDYSTYATADINQVFSETELKKAQKLEITTMETIWLENSNGKLIPSKLPPEAQFAPVHAIQTGDFNQDGHQDLLLAGNQSAIRIRLGVIDANFGQVFLGNGNGNFNYLPQVKSGLKMNGDVKDLQLIVIGGRKYLLAGINNQKLEAYTIPTR